MTTGASVYSGVAVAGEHSECGALVAEPDITLRTMPSALADRDVKASYSAL